MKDKKFVITSTQREEILNFIRSKNYVSARNMLNQLPILEENSNERREE